MTYKFVLFAVKCSSVFNEFIELFSELIDPLLVQEKHLMNENGLFELFPHKCPSCDGKLQTKKLNEGTLVTLTQQCLLCEYQNEYKKQITASTTVQQSSTGSTEVEVLLLNPLI